MSKWSHNLISDILITNLGHRFRQQIYNLQSHRNELVFVKITAKDFEKKEHNFFVSIQLLKE